MLHDLVHLVVGDERAVHALREAGARRQVQHVALAEQRLRAHLVEDGARIDVRRNLERDARRDVRLDEAGDHVDRRALRREDQVDARGARLLREPRDQLLDLLADHHHQVGELVDHDDDERHLVQRLRGSPASSANGLSSGAFAFSASRTFWLKPAMLRTPSALISL